MNAHEQARKNVEKSAQYVLKQYLTNKEIKNLYAGKQDYREED